MRKVILYMMVTLDGFFEGPNGEIDWHNVDQEFNELAIEQLDSVDILLFGRKTYELMASYWPTPACGNGRSNRCRQDESFAQNCVFKNAFKR